MDDVKDRPDISDDDFDEKELQNTEEEDYFDEGIFLDLKFKSRAGLGKLNAVTIDFMLAMIWGWDFFLRKLFRL